MAVGAGDWRATVQVRRADEWSARWATAEAAGERPVGVTDLLDLRTAHFRRMHPLPLPPEQQARLTGGRELHAEIGARLARRPEQVEVRLRRDGIVGQIDWIDDVPAELKTTANVPDPAALRTSRPQYLEQLAMYCAMTGSDQGRLLVVPSAGTPVEAAYCVRVRFAEPSTVWPEMQRRAGLLRAAEASGDATALPRCRWFERGCPYREARICPCTGEEPSAVPLATDRLTSLEPDEAATTSLRRALAEVNALPAPFPERFTDLIYPRRAFYRQNEVAPPAATSGWVRSAERDRLFRRIVEGLESTDPAGQGRWMPSHGSVREAVPRVEGRPYLIKITRAAPRTTVAALLADQSQYFLELGLRCQAVDEPSGWLILGYEGGRTDRAAISVFDVRFEPLDVVRRFAEAREAELKRAVADRAGGGLAACPGWMYRDCPYRAACGCGAVPDAPNR